MYLNIEYNFILANKNWIIKQISYSKIKIIKNLLHIKKTRLNTYFIINYIYLLFYFSNTNNKKCLILTKIICKIYLIDNLKIKILIKNNILILKSFLIDLAKCKTIISSYNITIQIIIKPREFFILKKI